MMMGPFIYSASSVAVAAKFDGPPEREKLWAPAALPMIGGEYTAPPESEEGWPPENPVLSFVSAEAHVKGWEGPPGVFNTLNKVTVTGLNVLSGLLTADTIEVSLKFIFKKAPKEVLKVEVGPKNPYTNLLIDGQNYSNVELDGYLPDSAGKDHDKFCKDDLPVKRKNEHHRHPNLKTVFTYISNDPEPNQRLTSGETEHAYHDFSKFGRVHFGEWASEKDWQGLVGLRIVLNSSPAGKGEIVIADWLGNNGQFYP